MIDKKFIDAHLDGLKECVKSASNAILEVYESNDFGEINKQDGSPITIADKNANEIILNRLNLLTPDIPIISEETFEEGSLQSLNETYWLVDPLDGTKEFINKTGEFTVNIALINNGNSIFGIVAAPVSGKIWNSSILDKHSEVDSVPDNIRIVMSKSHKNQNDVKFLEFLDTNKVQYQIVEKGSSLKLCSLADNDADIYPRFGPTSEWDIAAAHAVLNSHGGSVINIEKGKKLDYAKKSTILNPYFMAFRNKALENEFLHLLRDFFKKLV
tara:strand:+ start:176 stop:988 length:813 start_codon:yes stop_codon:yes gene_type:complete